MEQRYRVLPGGEEHEELWIGSRAALEEPARVSLPPPAPAAGLLLPDGGVNWACPCLGGMATGPCGTQFRDAFSCFHYSTADPKGSDCYEKFSTMQECMAEFPTLYGRDDDDDLAAAMGGEGEEAEAPAGRSAGSASPQPDGDAK